MNEPPKLDPSVLCESCGVPEEAHTRRVIGVDDHGDAVIQCYVRLPLAKTSDRRLGVFFPAIAANE